MHQSGERIACLTYTNRAVGVVRQRLGPDDLFLVSTLHGFLWGEIKAFQRDIQSAVVAKLIPERIFKRKEKDNGGQSREARSARRRIAEFESDLVYLKANTQPFTYEETGGGSRYSKGRLDHDDVIDLFALMIESYPALKNIIGQRYPYIFVDEAQDTFPVIVDALNSIASGGSLPLVGYFGDPMQQIYEKRAGNFRGPNTAAVITKPENYRCSTEVIRLLNLFRQDIHQVPGPKNAEGSVEIRLIRAEHGLGEGGSYTDAQTMKAVAEFDRALAYFGWADDEAVKRLFLARQMIARRLGFSELNRLFKGSYSSLGSEADYDDGKHYLLQPFTETILPIVDALASGDQRALFKRLRKTSPLLDPKGENGTRSLKHVSDKLEAATKSMADIWPTASIGEILRTARDQKLIQVSDRLGEHLDRSPRSEVYIEEFHALDKADWLADEFFKMKTEELPAYARFTRDETALSTQHGVKGEEYNKVLVVFDDTEARWTHYNFSRLLTPKTADGKITDGQKERGTKLAYVCFSRAERDLRIILFTPNPGSAKTELVDRGLFRADQISIQ